jgi:hypothetical protein
MKSVRVIARRWVTELTSAATGGRMHDETCTLGGDAHVEREARMRERELSSHAGSSTISRLPSVTTAASS